MKQNMNSLTEVDWTQIPAPTDDGAADHLKNKLVPGISLLSTDGDRIDLSSLNGWCVLYIYPMTGKPGVELPDGWDLVPGARGCTPQSCSFRDNYEEILELGVSFVFGLSTQDSPYQKEARERLELPFPLLSDIDLKFSEKLNLPVFTIEGNRLLKRITLIMHNGKISHAFYPVFPPDRNAQDVINWFKCKND